MRKLIFFIMVLLAASCKQKPKLIIVSKTLIDSIKKLSDTSYIKAYRTDDFYKAMYFVKRKDSTVFQIMLNKDSLITQIVGVKKSIKTLEQNFYNNGQLKAKLTFDANGKKTGEAIYYYENGNVKSEGKYSNGFSVGQWKEYNEKNDSVTLLEYDSNGVRKN